MSMLHENEVSGVSHGHEPSASVGRTLRAARESQGMSVNDVANRIKFAPKQIEWLEADDFVRLPEAAFVRGFVRSYARMLELDPAQLLALLPTSHVQPAQSQEVKSVEITLPSALGVRRHNIVWLVAALLVAILLAIFERMNGHGPEQPDTVPGAVVQPLELPGGTPGGDAGAPQETAAAGDVAGQDGSATPPQPPATPAPAPQAAPAPVAVVPAPVPAVVAPVKPEPVVAAPAPAPVVAEKPAEKIAPPVQPEASKPAVPEHKRDPHVAQQQAAQWEALQPYMMQPAGKPNTLTDTPQHTRVIPPRPPRTAAQIAAITHAQVAADGSRPGAGGAADHALRLEFDEDAWAEVKGSDGNVLLSRMHSAGSLVRVSGKGPLDVVIGNARAVRLFDNGKKINLEKYTTAEVAHIRLK